MKSKNDLFWDAVFASIRPDVAKFYAGEGRQLDMERDFEFLDQEMEALGLDKDDPGRIRIDRLIKVFRQDGEDEWFMVHLAMKPHEALGRRLFDCACQVETLSKKRVTPFWIKLGIEKEANGIDYGELTYELHYLGSYTDEELSRKTAGSTKLQMKLLRATLIMLQDIEPGKKEAILDFLTGMVELDEEEERLFEERLAEFKGLLEA
jgi:hypothetical protein